MPCHLAAVNNATCLASLQHVDYGAVRMLNRGRSNANGRVDAMPVACAVRIRYFCANSIEAFVVRVGTP